MPSPKSPDKTSEHEDLVLSFDENLEHLRHLYEQYFLGLDRKSPEQARKKVEAQLRQILTLQTNNTSLRFRIGNLKAKMVTYATYWDRCLHQMEEGTFRRDRFRLKMKDRDAAAPEGAEKKADAAKAASSKPAASSRNTAVDTLLQQYLTARKKCNESVDGISYEAFSKTISTQASQLKTRLKCKTVRFKVVIENGKTKLKATPV